MAYKNLINETVIEKTNGAWFTHFRDFLCARDATHNYAATGIGWTLLDSSYATDEDNPVSTDWIIVSSTGENGDEQLYFKFEVYSTAYLRASAFLYYDGDTHTGTRATGYAYALYTLADNWEKIWIYGDLDAVSIMVEQSSSTHLCDGTWFGKYNSTIDEGPQTIALALTQGNDVAITVGDVTSEAYAVGKYAFLYDNDNCNRALIKTNNGSDTITCDITNSFTAGAKLRTIIPYNVEHDDNGFILLAAASHKEVFNTDGVYNLGTIRLNPAVPTTTTFDPNKYGQYAVVELNVYVNAANKGNMYKFKNILYSARYVTMEPFDMIELEGSNYRLLEMSSFNYYFLEV